MHYTMLQHLTVLGLVCFVAIVLFLRLYLGYVHAKKRHLSTVGVSVAIPTEGLCFRPQKYRGVLCTLFACAYVIVAGIGYTRLSKQPDPNAAILVLDSIIPVALVFLWAGLEAFNSHLFITQEGFEQKTLFSKKYYPAKEIKNIYRDSEIIFIAINNKKLPVGIDKIYDDLSGIHAALYTLKEQARFIEKEF